ncbi:hypothetical protein UFOVP1655_25 [uncultured Caudovirales phage]|jgi:hypothetical protein|uniref:Uncharacterized protein n=1 Tax=uncultured Caudovirales phage TaxID=2100421 RepID=A0A6J5T4Q5_9CAUD|nr:hypothetical protein UFOVP1655_25 [uncultured Caudovirales phage]
MIKLKEHDADNIKLVSCEQLNINEFENYNIFFSEILIDKTEVCDVIKLLQDYNNAQ